MNEQWPRRSRILAASVAALFALVGGATMTACAAPGTTDVVSSGRRPGQEPPAASAEPLVALGAPASSAPGLAAATSTDDELQLRIEAIVAEGRFRAPGAEIAVAVRRLDGAHTIGVELDRPFISASVAKAWWAAAALAAGGLGDVWVVSTEVFAQSSDVASTALIEAAGGPDAVNDFTSAIGMADTLLVRWVGGDVLTSSAYPGPLDGSNVTTARDAITFLTALAGGGLLGGTETAALLEWMTLSPRTAEDGPAVASVLTERLPPDVAAEVAHKAGWLLPSDHPGQGHLLDIGIVIPAAPGTAYAVALFGADDTSYDELIEFFRDASCEIYLAIAADSDWTCHESLGFGADG